MLQKSFRLTSNKEYNQVYNHGKRFTGRFILVFIRKNALNNNRFGIVTSKKIGKAVTRNLVKRRIRAIIAGNMDRFHGHNDVVLVARYNTGEAPYHLLEKDVLTVLRKAGLC